MGCWGRLERGVILSVCQVLIPSCTTPVNPGYVKKNLWHMVTGDGQGKLVFDFTGWRKRLVEMNDNYASFIDNFRWSNLAQTGEILDVEEYSTLIRAEGGFR